MSTQKNTETTSLEAREHKSTLLKVIDVTVDSVVRLADANSVMGEPIVTEGMTIIPVSKLSVGFAGGGADVIDASRQKKQNPAGAGAKISLTPLTFLVISEGTVKTVSVSAPAPSNGGFAATVIDAVVAKIKSMSEEKKAKKAEEKENKENS